MQKVFCVNPRLRTTMPQLTPQKLRQMTCTKLKCVKNHPQKIASNDMHNTEMRQKSPPKKVRQLTWKK
jgi:hypothetical protein